MRVLLLAGGGGTRLWPLSTEAHPKQFLPLLSDRSLLRETWDRVAPVSDEIFVATSERYVPLVRRELPGVEPERLLVEMARRNSGPAVLAAALRFEAEGDPITAVIPSDQTVSDAGAFHRALADAGDLADRSSVVLLAVAPTRPETGFGYLELQDRGPGEGAAVIRFLEKPGGTDAESLVRRGHFWNAGIFVFRPSRLLAEARRVAASLLAGVEAFHRRLHEGDAEGAAAAWEALPEISIDFAVMEKAAGVRAVPLAAGWSDLGTWRSVRELRGASDDRGNLILSDRPLLAPGARDTAIVVAEAGVLVMPFNREGELRAGVEGLRRSASIVGAAPAAGGSEIGTAERGDP